MNNKKVVIGMSGGLDSSVAAYLLKKQGYDVIGITLKLYADGSRCCSLEDIEDARTIAYELGIPFYVVDYEKEFTDYVVKNFCDEYVNGRTPNPCVICNEKIKFGVMLKKAEQLGASYISTGHYVKKKFDGKRYFLEKGDDLKKDQSYFLYRLSQEQIKRSLFPLGEYTKTEIKKIADEAGMHIISKNESQEVCFVTKGKYPEFIETKCGYKSVPGKILDYKGKQIGQHKGMIYYTIGQRRGLGISSETPLYVTEINAEKNIIVAGPKQNIYKKKCIVKNLNWVSIESLNEKIKCCVKIRYNHTPAECYAIPIDNNTAEIIFEKEQFAVTPGQSAVLYKDNILIGGGVITINACS